RQGGLDVEPDPLGLSPLDQGDVPPGERLPVPVPKLDVVEPCQGRAGVARTSVCVAGRERVEVFASDGLSLAARGVLDVSQGGNGRVQGLSPDMSLRDAEGPG